MDCLATMFSGVLPSGVIEDLRCSYCGGHFDKLLAISETIEGLTDGILRCDCYEYPVIGGIAILRQMSPAWSIRNEAVEKLKQRDVAGALQWLLETGSAAGVPRLAELRAKTARLHHFARRVRQKLGVGSESFLFDLLRLSDGFEAVLRRCRTRGYADYLYHRFANPSLLGAIPPLLVFADGCRHRSRRRVVDLLCGAGHTSALLATLYPDIEVVAADADFINLFLARNFVVPKVVALCLDADLPLPFANASVEGLFCLDGLHYVRSKMTLLEQVDRIVSDQGFWLFAHLHNVLQYNVNPGAPLSPAGYAKRFAFGEQRLLPESMILRQFEGGCLDLTAQPGVDTLGSENALTLIGGRTKLLWSRHPNLELALCRRPDLLEFNPLYRVVAEGSEVILRAHWPSDALRDECTVNSGTPLLAESMCIPRRVVDDIIAAKCGGQLSPDVLGLVRSFALTALPICYPRTDLLRAQGPRNLSESPS
jgi:SAM-dependent methyltransferase